MVDMAFFICIAFTIFTIFYLSVKQQRSKRCVKIRLKFKVVQDDEVEGKENFYKLLAAVIQNHPQFLQNADQNQRVEIEIAGETIYIAISEGSEEVIDLNHVVDHLRYCIQTITEDTANCIKLMMSPPGPNFQTFITTLRLALPNNATLDIISDPPIRTNTNLVLWPSGYSPHEWMERYKTSNSVIHTVKDYEDTLERKGLDGISKTKKENIRRMLKLNMINPGDGLYLVRTKCGMTYAHVAVVTDAKLMNFVHVSKKMSLPFFGEYGTIVNDHFEKVVKQEDKCFIVRHKHKELTGQDIANRAMTFAFLPALTFTYNVINANCEVAFNAAAGIFQQGRGSLQGQLVQEPYYDRFKRIFGLTLEKLQRSPEADLLEKLYFKLLNNEMLYDREPAPGHPVSQPADQSGFPSAFYISSSGGAKEDHPEYMGTYKLTEDFYQNQPVYLHEANKAHLFHNSMGDWAISRDPNPDLSSLKGPKSTTSDFPSTTGWQYVASAKPDLTARVQKVKGSLSYQISSDGAIKEKHPTALGVYTLTQRLYNNKNVYKHTQGNYFLYVGKRDLWRVSPELEELGDFYSLTDSALPPTNGWRTHGSGWTADPSLTVERA